MMELVCGSQQHKRVRYTRHRVNDSRLHRKCCLPHYVVCSGASSSSLSSAHHAIYTARELTCCCNQMYTRRCYCFKWWHNLRKSCYKFTVDAISQVVTNSNFFMPVNNQNGFQPSTSTIVNTTVVKTGNKMVKYLNNNDSTCLTFGEKVALERLCWSRRRRE